MNPFSIQPATASRFYGRSREIEILTQRSVGSGESTVVVGEFPNGKGSLVRELHHRLRMEECRLSFIDAQSLPHSCTPEQFWSQALSQFGASRRARYAYRDIESLLRADGVCGRCVMVIDGIQAIAHLPAFASPDLWGMLRAFTQSQGLVLVGTSNVDLVTLTEMTRGLTLGSPFFNAMRELVLGPLDADAVSALLAQANPRFSISDMEWITACTGGSPKLLHLLASSLWEMAGGRIAPHRNARTLALAECRQEARHIFSAVWPLFPWEERWLMLRVALAQCCGLEFSRASVESPQTREPPVGGAEKALVDLMEQRLTRVEIKRLLRETSGHTPELLLPGDSAIGLDFYSAAASVIVRHGLVHCFLERMLQWVPGCAEDISTVAGHWDCTIKTTVARWQPINTFTQRLAARGLIERTLHAPGWMVTPPLFYWWLIDQIQALAGGSDLTRWMAQQGLDGATRLSMAEAKVFAHQADRHADLLRSSTTQLREEVRQ